MEFHVPGPVRSLKDFFVHLGIVTLGILIALGLEQIVEAHHRVKIGHESVASFRHELAENRDHVNEVLASLPHVHEQIQAQIARITALGDAPPRSGVPIQPPSLRYDFLSTAAWDTAIATQALNYIPEADARRYSESYTAFRLFMDEERGGLAIWQELHGFGTDAAALTPEQRRSLIQQLQRYDGYASVLAVVGRGTLAACERALQ